MDRRIIRSNDTIRFDENREKNIGFFSSKHNPNQSIYPLHSNSNRNIYNGFIKQNHLNQFENYSIGKLFLRFTYFMLPIFRLSIRIPASLSFYLDYIQIETSTSNLDHKRIKTAFEQAIIYFGPTSAGREKKVFFFVL